MCARRQPVVVPSKRTRAAVTNGSKAHQNVDERSSGARRFRDLVAAYSADLGDNLSEADLAMVRIAAALTQKSEQMQAALAAGENVDSDSLIRLAGTTRRSLAAISAKAADRKPGALSLAEYLARRTEQPDEAEDEDEDT
jgi:ribosomal protein L12E/L44/L45/RPP1/RPP2